MKHSPPCATDEIVKRHPMRTQLRAAIAALLITGAIGTALAVASGTVSAPVTENLCTASGNGHTIGTDTSTVTAAPAAVRPVAVQIPVNTCCCTPR
jgi:hypothetical protein